MLISQLRVFCKTVDEVLNNVNAAETARYASYADMARTYNDIATRVNAVLNVSTMFYTFNLEAMPSWGDTVWPTQKRILEQVLLSARMLNSLISVCQTSSLLGLRVFLCVKCKPYKPQ